MFVANNNHAFSTTPLSLHLTSYNPKLDHLHTSLIRLELQVFAPKKNINATPPKCSYNVVLVQSASLHSFLLIKL